ncbi:hypothetical protein GCM10023321_12490 [Pseudonocardia eucalypti]|uniref:Uncharacterized protein n=1 Tax=Pseudonocardia eucalypti TaxID=648755 RepID=A0ABP9PNS4_9PSEU|nr:hypothetical protein [Pseudonocardia eucalypti]
MAWSNEVSAADEGFHRRTDDPWWNESSFTTFRIPERRLFGILYHYVRPNQRTAMAGPWFVDDTGDEMSTALYNGFDWHLPVPDGADMFDVEFENGYAVRTVTPQLAYRHTYRAPGCEFDLTFTADRPPVAMLSAGEEVNRGMRDFVQDVERHATGHYEQTGVMNGSLRIEGEAIDVVDAAVIKDRTWGPRRILIGQPKPRGSYTFARADRDNSFQAFAMSDRDWETDPLVGAADPVVHGFYVRDGVQGRLVSGVRRVLERRPDGRPVREELDAVDEHGRELHAVGTVRSLMKWHSPYGGVMTFWCYEDWSFDGHRDAPGELQDWTMGRQFSRWVRDPGRVLRAGEASRV